MTFPRAIGVVALLACALGTITQPSVAQNDAGPYSAAQAAAGAKLYGDNCAECHGAKLEGGNGPALAGDAFVARWNGKTAADLNAFASSQMPLTDPGSLKPAEYLALIAFVLQQNKYPAGPSPLDAATLKNVKIVPQKPGGT